MPISSAGSPRWCCWLLGVALLFPALAERITAPLVAAGTRLSASSDKAQHAGARIGWSFVLGIAVGLLWTPCAGPILGLVLTGAALQGASANATLLLFAYALGAATSLALALLAGGRVTGAMRRALGAGEWLRRALGVAVLVGVVAIALGLDTRVLAGWSLGSTTHIEERLLDLRHPDAAKDSTAAHRTLAVEGPMPSIAGAVAWLNSPPLVTDSLRGKVVLVDFWTYSCINCLRALPYVKAWADKYRAAGLVVIGVHAPEFAFERDEDNVRRAVRELGVTYPVALDNNYTIWRAFKNEYWPAHYFVDANGQIRYHHFGEGDYAESERVIQTLLREAGATNVPTDTVVPNATGALAPAAPAEALSPETFVGYGEGGEHFASGRVVRDTAHMYHTPGTFTLNQWGLDGHWRVEQERGYLVRAPGRIAFRFHARDLHLVLGPGPHGAPIRFRVTIDGAAPGDAHGADMDAQGNGAITEQRLYQLIRQHGTITDHTFEIEFLDPGVSAFSFTFG
jgi:thiol-disulfide isomerase/thioredoxin